MPKIDIIGPAYQDDSLDINAQRCVNMYLNVNANEAATSEKQLLPTPGTKQMIDLSASECRGMIAHIGRIFVVADNNFIELEYNPASDTMTSTTHGQINTTTGNVSMAASPLEIIIVDGTDEAFIFTLATDTLAAITDLDFPPASTVTFNDGYFIVNPGTDGTMYSSAILDGTSWNALDFDTAQSKGDKLLRVIAFNDEIWAFGEESIEVWYNAANATGFPYSLRGDIVLDLGCVSKDSVVSFKNSLFWLDQDGNIYSINGYTPQLISTNAMATEIGRYETISDAVAYAYSEAGHFFYVITFPTANKTWAFDMKTGSWHERATLTLGGSLDRHPAQCYAYHQRKHFIGDFNSGRIYRLANDVYTDAGEEIKRIRTTRHGNIDNKNVTVYNVELRLEAGTGLASGQGSDPQVALEISRDGGHTWTNEIWRSIGKAGEYNKRVRWDRLGTGRNFTFRFTLSDPVKFVLIGATSDLGVGT